MKNSGRLNEFAQIVDMGEASAIPLAQEIEVNYVITDDMDARKLCAELHLPFIGTLGLLLRGKETGIVNTIKPLIEKIKQTNFRLSEELYLRFYEKRANCSFYIRKPPVFSEGFPMV